MEVIDKNQHKIMMDMLMKCDNGYELSTDVLLPYNCYLDENKHLHHQKKCIALHERKNVCAMNIIDCWIVNVIDTLAAFNATTLDRVVPKNFIVY